VHFHLALGWPSNAGGEVLLKPPPDLSIINFPSWLLFFLLSAQMQDAKKVPVRVDFKQILCDQANCKHPAS